MLLPASGLRYRGRHLSKGLRNLNTRLCAWLILPANGRALPNCKRANAPIGSDMTSPVWSRIFWNSGSNRAATRLGGTAQRSVSPKRVPLETCETVLRCYAEVYCDVNMPHLHENLSEEYGIQMSYTRVQKAQQGDGVVARRSKRGTHRSTRPRG
jgi:hypothetical protein